MLKKDILEKALETVSLNTGELKNATDINWDKYISDIRSRRFVERTLHVIIEACIDIANHIISVKGFREPSTYREAFVVLAENGILPEESLGNFEKIAMFRNLIVHYYEKVDDEIVFAVFKNNLEDFEMYISYILEFIEKES